LFHLIPAADGCAAARDWRAVAVVVDTLRASSTLALLCDRGVAEVLVVSEVEEARDLARRDPAAVLLGERNGLPPDGFHPAGNSPVQVRQEDWTGRRVIFTSTTGSHRATAAYGSTALFFGAPVNARAVARAAADAARIHGCDIVLIPAGHISDPHGTGPEDAAGATGLGLELQALGWKPSPDVHWAFDVSHPEEWTELAATLIRTSPHADYLRSLGPEFEDDIRFCAQWNVTAAVPQAVGTSSWPGGGMAVRFRPRRLPAAAVRD